MSDSLKCNAQETAACCCVDVGTVMDNTDLTASYKRVFDSRAEAESMLNALTEKRARQSQIPVTLKALWLMSLAALS